MKLGLVGLLLVFGSSFAAAAAEPSILTANSKPLSDTAFWSFQRHLGKGTLTRDTEDSGGVLAFSATNTDGMAASVLSPPLSIEPSREYTVTMEIKTEGFKPITAKLAGGVYVQFNDQNGWPGGWYPAVALFGPPALIAPPDTDWHSVSQVIQTPTTARTGVLHLAFAAYGTWAGGHPRVTGRARGQLWIRHVRIEVGKRIEPLPLTIHVPDQTVQAGLQVVSDCLHNASLSGPFVVSDGYTISGNIVPDLSFGLFGVRRLGHPEYVRRLEVHWRQIAQSMNSAGRIASQRVMSQVLFPLGVDELFSFTGDEKFLREFLPLADRALGFVIDKADADGLARMVEYGQWHIGEGADWVDWYPARMEGKTFMFHAWFVRALRRLAALHEEQASVRGVTGGADHTALAHRYRMLADRVVRTLQARYWRGNHFITNIDFGGKVVDETWMDDQVWAIRWGIASADMARQIWHWVDADCARLEGVPTRWAAFDGPAHGPLSWFGRTGAGDILARYAGGDSIRGLALLTRISQIFARDRNVYEAYDMNGKVASGTSGWGNYTEHCGGFVWAIIGGPFGIDFDSDAEALATVAPRFPSDWTRADAAVYLRGTRIDFAYSKTEAGGQLRLSGSGPARPVRLLKSNGQATILRIGNGTLQNVSLEK